MSACLRERVRAYVHTYVHTCVRACMRASVRACVRPCSRTCVRARVCVRARAYVRACVRVCVRACVRERVRACVRACVLVGRARVFSVLPYIDLHLAVSRFNKISTSANRIGQCVCATYATTHKLTVITLDACRRNNLVIA